MGILFSRRHDFLTYEKSLEKITQESSKLLVRRTKRKAYLNGYRRQLLNACFISLVPCVAWVAYLRQQTTDYHSIAGYFSRTAAPFAFPLLTYVLATALLWLLQLVEKREEKQLKKFDNAKKKLIKELKDTTNFEKTMALLKKYDPEVHVPASPAAGRQKIKGGQAAAALTPGSSKATSNLLTTALDSVGTFATKFMGDNPTLLEELRKAHTAAMCLKQENDMLRQQLVQLCSKYDETPVFLSLTSLVLPEGPSQGSDGTSGTAPSGVSAQTNVSAPGKPSRKDAEATATEAQSKAAGDAPASDGAAKKGGSAVGKEVLPDAAKELPESCNVAAKKAEAKVGKKQAVK